MALLLVRVFPQNFAPGFAKLGSHDGSLCIYINVRCEDELDVKCFHRLQIVSCFSDFLSTYVILFFFHFLDFSMKQRLPSPPNSYPQA